MARRDPVRPDAVDAILEQWRRELPEVDVAPLAVFGRIHRVFLRYQAHITDVFNEYGINAAAFDIMAALRRHGAPYRLTAGALADTSLITSGGVSLRLDRLEKVGLVTRERDEVDKRVVYVKLTDAGVELIEKVAAAHFANEENLLVGLTPTERRQLGQLLSRLERSLDGYETTLRGNGGTRAEPDDAF
ncbi:MarR family winged helix-turn-helix transcriptional regulator [Streptomyces umbrinus]|uniref:MarR family winged helix-turn-helix transcriptional regulator n=1 Tax=Streptomyces umbrinus TaxID=67370 RepID=UPI003407B6E2